MIALQNTRGDAAEAKCVGRNGLGGARPDGGQGRDLYHPGIVAWPGCISTFAALSASLDTRSTARETPPTLRLPGNPIEPPSRCIHAGFLPGVGDWETPRCSMRGLFVSEGRVFRARNLFANESPVLGGLNDCARDSADVLPRVGLHAHSMEIAHGKVRAEDNSKISGE